MRRIKAKANAMEDADVQFVSLVSRPASRIPFRLTKSDDDPATEGFMIHLKQMFKRDGDAPKGCTLVGVVLQRKHEEHLAPKIKELGLKIDDRVEQDDVVILKQADFDEDKTTAIKLGEVGGLFSDVPEHVIKAFDPFAASDNFDENMALGFLPGMSAATEALFDTVVQVLRTADSPDDARGRIETNIDKYKSAVLDMANNLPQMAFKLEALDLDGYVEIDKESGAAEVKPGGTAGQPKPEAEAPAEEAPAAEAPAAEAAPAEAEAEAEATPEEEEAAPAEETVEKDASGLTPEEQAKLKGVHIEDLDVQPDANEESTDETVAKSDESEPKSEIADILSAFKSEVLEAISSVKSDVNGLKSKQDELTEKVNTTAAIADRAQKAVKGTVRSGSDAGDRVRDESLGTRSRKKGNTDDATWGGTALDRIVGDFGGE